MVLEEIGGRVEPRSRVDQPCGGRYVPRTICLVPGSEPLWAYSAKLHGLTTISFVFDPEDLREGMAETLPRGIEFLPQLRFSDDVLWQIGRLLALECVESDAPSNLYAGHLVMALIACVARNQGGYRSCTRGGLTQKQLNLVLEYVDTNIARSITLGELAQLTGLSQSHFSHAFKVSTGMPPYRWQLEMRVRHAQQLLLDGRNTLAEVALATGFGDQSHFTRVFARLAGATPAAWRRDRRA